MSTRYMQTAAALLALATLAGCAATSPNWDRNFGDSVRATVASQVADPSAALNTNPVSGIDGRAAIAIQRRYETSFAIPAVHEPAMTTGSGK